MDEQNQLIEPPNQPVAKKPFLHWSRGIFIVTIIVGISIIGAAFLLLTNKSFPPRPQTIAPTSTPANETTNWKKYTGNFFSVTYPSNLILDNTPSGETLETIKLTKSKSTLNNYVQIDANSGGENLYNNRKKTLLAFGIKNEKQDELSLNQVKAWKISGTDNDGNNYREYILLYKNNTMFEIDNFGLDDHLFNQILSTFKLTEQTTDTSNWKTYTNTKIGFSIKYPTTYLKPELPGGIGNFINYATGKEDDTSIIFTPDQYSGFNIYVIPFSGTLDAYITSNPHPSILTQSDCKPNKLVSNLMVDGTPAKMYVTSSKNYPTCENVIYFVNKHHGFSLIQQIGRTDNLNLEQILSTFKFTNNISAATPDQIFQEVATTFNLKKDQLNYFRIFVPDRVQYGISGFGTTYAYKYNGTWHIAQKNHQSVANCDDLAEVPEIYRPPCDTPAMQFNYIDSQRQSINYPPAEATHYIGD